MTRASIEKLYNGYRLSGEAESVSNYGRNWYATGRVWVNRSDNSSIMADCFRDSDRLLTYEDKDTARCIALWLAEVSVDNFLPPVEYYLTPMNAAWAVTILRRARPAKYLVPDDFVLTHHFIYYAFRPHLDSSPLVTRMLRSGWHPHSADSIGVGFAAEYRTLALGCIILLKDSSFPDNTNS